MAEGRRFVCTHCHRAVEAWSDGHPYDLDATGAKRYAYHPDDQAVARCIGTDTPHLCLCCGAEFLVDSRLPRHECPACGAADCAPTFGLHGQRCPSCHVGEFREDPDYGCIS